MEIHGNRVIIRETTIENLSELMTLWNDGRVMKWVGFPNGFGYNNETIEDWFHRLQANPNRHHFIVQTPELGFCGEVYYAVDRIHKRASLDIKLKPEAQGQGLATDALRMLIRLVYSLEPEVEATWTEPSEQNIAARKLYQRCGLRPKSRPLDMEQGPSYWEVRREEWTEHFATS